MIKCSTINHYYTNRKPDDAMLIGTEIDITKFVLGKRYKVKAYKYNGNNEYLVIENVYKLIREV